MSYVLLESWMLARMVPKLLEPVDSYMASLYQLTVVKRNRK